MLNSTARALKVQEEFEECGHSFALMIALLSTELHLTQRARLALIEYGATQLDRFEQAEALLRNYLEETAPS